MGGLRHTLRVHRHLALACALLALVLRLLLPSGLMLENGGRTISVAICADATGLSATRILAKAQDIHLPGKPAAPKGDSATAACPYAALGMASLAGADPVLLAAALTFLILLGFAAVTAPPLARCRHLRPPLRAPPRFRLNPNPVARHG